VSQIIWSPQAIEDVETIRTYVARDSPRYADLLVERLVSAVEGLATDPLSGPSSMEPVCFDCGETRTFRASNFRFQRFAAPAAEPAC
jgi:plasmid stabilization system protein ParE